MKFMKILSKRTKIEAGGMILLISLISLSSVFGGLDGNDPTIAYIKNGNGNYWVVANATNLQESLDQGGVTYFPATTIYTNKTITIPSYSSLIGTGLNSILKADIGLSPTSSLIKNADKNGNVYLEIRNLVLDGSNYTHSIGNPYTNYGLYWNQVSYGIVDMVWVKDTGKDGIRLETCSYCSATHINTYSTGHHAVMFCYGTNHSLMSDLIIRDSFTESAIVEHANRATGELNHHITITNVIAKNCSQYGIFIRDAYSVIVTGCITNASDDNGFYIGNCHDVIISNCVTNDNRDHAGFVVNTSGNEVLFTNCIARHAGTRTDSRGFELRGQNIQVSNCAVYDTKTPFNITHTARNITISGCTIVNYTNPCIVWGDNVRFCDNKFLNHTATSYVLNITHDATNTLVNDNDFRFAPTVFEKINDLSGNTIIYDNMNGSAQPPAPPANESLDQQQIQYSSNFGIYTTRITGQSFIPTKHLLTSVEIYLRKIGNPPNAIKVSIRTTRDGADLVNILKSASQISTSYEYVKFDFNDLVVTPGIPYFIIVETSGGTSSNCYQWGYEYQTLYTDGIRVICYDGTTWYNNPSYDNCFKTYGI